MSKHIKNALIGKTKKAYTKLCAECEDVGEEFVELTEGELMSLVGQTEPFDSIGAELEKHMYQERQLYLNSEVCAETVDHIVMLIHKWNHEDYGVDVSERIPIVLYVDTHGGDLAKATTLVSAMENSVTPIITYAEGAIMSAGLWIFLAGHYRIATRHADFMYHELRVGSNGEMTTLREIHNSASYFEHLQVKIDNYIIETTNITQEMLDSKKYTNVDWFIDANDLLDLGIVDELL